MLLRVLRLALINLFILFSIFAGDTEDIAKLKAENDLLRAQLIQAQIEYQYQAQVCAMPDLMKARLATAAAKEKIPPDDKK